MGKGIAFAGFLGSIRKRRKLYMFLVMLSLGFFERKFLYFWARKGFCLWSFGGLEQWYFLYLLCHFSPPFLSHLSVLNCA